MVLHLHYKEDKPIVITMRGIHVQQYMRICNFLTTGRYDLDDYIFFVMIAKRNSILRDIGLAVWRDTHSISLMKIFVL